MWTKIGVMLLVLMASFLIVVGILCLTYEMTKPSIKYKEFTIEYVYHDHLIVGHTVTNNQTKEKWLAIKYSGVIPLTQVEGGKD